VEVQLRPFLLLAVDGGKWLTSCPQHFIPQGKSSQNPLNMRLVRPNSQSVYFGEEKNLFFFIHILFPKIPYTGVYPVDVGIVNKLAL